MHGMWSCAGKQVATEALTRQDQQLAVGRLGALIDQIEALVSRGVQVILVRFLLPSCLVGGASSILDCCMSKVCLQAGFIVG